MRARACLVAVVLSLSSAVVAQADDVPAARKNFELAIQHEEKGDWAGALVLMRKVALVKTNHIVRFHLALCLEKTGKLVEALNEFARAKVMAEKDGGTDADLTIANAGKHMTALRARIPSVLVKRPAIDGVTVTIDGESALFDAAMPVDPGEHAIEVRAPSRKPFQASVTAVEGVTTPIAIEPTFAAESTTTKAPIATTKPRVPDVATPSRTVPWVLGGIGAVTLVGAGVAYGLRASALSELDATCNDARAACDPAKSALEDRGRTYTIAGNVLLGVSAVAIVSAVTWVALEPSRAPGPAVAVVLGPWSGLRGTF